MHPAIPRAASGFQRGCFVCSELSTLTDLLQLLAHACMPHDTAPASHQLASRHRPVSRFTCPHVRTSAQRGHYIFPQVTHTKSSWKNQRGAPKLPSSAETWANQGRTNAIAKQPMLFQDQPQVHRTFLVGFLVPMYVCMFRFSVLGVMIPLPLMKQKL